MKWGIIGAILVGLIIGGAIGIGVTHGSNGDVKTTVSVMDEKKTSLSEVYQGETVYIQIKVINNGNTAYPLSNHAPVFAYAKIYELDIDGKHLVDSVKYETKFVMWHVVSLQPNSNYTTYLQWTVPSNVTGIVEIDAWAGSSPIGTTTVDAVSKEPSGYDNEFVFIETDDALYTAGDTVHITIINMGAQPALFGSGFEIVNDENKVIASKLWRHMIELQPGESVDYNWTIPNDIQEGWYYLYDFANDYYTLIYIL